MADSKKQTVGQIITEEVYQYIVWMSRAVEKYARSYKFTIGERLQGSGLALIERVVEATFTRDRSLLLKQAQLEIERQRILWRLCADLKLIGADSYEHAARSLDAIGRAIGGWKKTHDALSARSAVRRDRELSGAAPGGPQGDQG